MSQRTIALLHVEDDAFQRQYLAHQLEGMKEFRFAITWAESEDAAVDAFSRGGVQLVILSSASMLRIGRYGRFCGPPRSSPKRQRSC